MISTGETEANSKSVFALSKAGLTPGENML